MVGEYRIEQVIGQGGFGTVYRAIHPLIGKQAAIKVLALRYSADPAVVSRFVAEAKAVNQIRHRNIIDIFAFGQLDDGRHYYVMEYLDGEPFDVYLREHGPMPLPEALPILRAVARALDAAHAKGIAHRDLKPENIFLARDSEGTRFPKLLDFGIAKLLAPEEDVRHKTGTGVPIGTPYYMSPEQCRGREVDHRTDIYSFGVLAYRVLTGAYPFDGDDYMDLMFKQVQQEPPPPSSKNPHLPASVDNAIAWMMRKDRAHRPPNVTEGVSALDPNASVTPSIPSSPPGVRFSVPPAPTDPLAATTAAPAAKPRSRKTLWIGSALVLVPAAAIALYVVNMRGADTKEPVAASTVADKGPITASNTVAPPPEVKPVVVPPDAASDVTITIEGVPPDTEVFVAGADRGVLDASHEVRVPRGDAEVEIALRAKGYVEQHRKILPDRDQKLDVTLAKLTRTPAKRNSNESHDSHDVIHVQFGDH
jgi:serine/threonine protein kinase